MSSAVRKSPITFAPKKMIVDKLIVTEFEIERKLRSDYNKLQAVKNLINLLKQVDFTSEVLPEEQPERLVRLLVSLKGKPLDDDENMMIKEIINK